MAQKGLQLAHSRSYPNFSSPQSPQSHSAVVTDIQEDHQVMDMSLRGNTTFLRENTGIDRLLQWPNSNLIFLKFKQGSLFLCIQTLDNYQTPGQDFHSTFVSSCNGKLSTVIVLMDLLLAQKTESVILRGKKLLNVAYVLENYMYRMYIFAWRYIHSSPTSFPTFIFKLFF